MGRVQSCSVRATELVVLTGMIQLKWMCDVCFYLKSNILVVTKAWSDCRQLPLTTTEEDREEVDGTIPTPIWFVCFECGRKVCPIAFQFFGVFFVSKGLPFLNVFYRLFSTWKQEINPESNSFVKGSVWRCRFPNPPPESAVGRFTLGKIT